MKRSLAIFSLSITYSLAKLVSVLTRSWIKSDKKHGRIIVNGTFHNPNWFHAHITPLVASGFGEVILVCDEPIAEMPNLIYKCPPLWANKVFSRAGAKAIWTFIQGIRTPADIYVGYHIFPSAVTALVCARLFGAKVIYQVTSGPLELEGGGWHAENKLLVALGKPSSFVESRVLSLLKEFDLVIVRGSSAKNYVLSSGYQNQIEVITGSIDTKQEIPEDKDIDLIFVGRLTEYKRPDRLIDVVAKVVQSLPQCKTVLVGDGPDRNALESQVRDLHLEKNIEFLGQREDVPRILGRAKLFILTSRWEGVSIAMLEAMAMKAVPIVGEVGDLADFAQNDSTGFIIDEDNLGEFARHIVSLLSDNSKRERMADEARNLVISRCDRQVLSSRWFKIFQNLAPG